MSNKSGGVILASLLNADVKHSTVLEDVNHRFSNDTLYQFAKVPFFSRLLKGFYHE